MLIAEYAHIYACMYIKKATFETPNSHECDLLSVSYDILNKQMAGKGIQFGGYVFHRSYTEGCRNRTFRKILAFQFEKA